MVVVVVVVVVAAAAVAAAVAAAAAEQLQEGTVAFLLQFSLQNEDGLQLYVDMSQLCHCGATMVSGIEAKKERSTRSPLANQISRPTELHVTGNESDLKLEACLALSVVLVKRNENALTPGWKAPGNTGAISRDAIWPKPTSPFCR